MHPGGALQGDAHVPVDTDGIIYKQVLGRVDLDLPNIASAKRQRRLPTVFDRVEIEALRTHLEGTPQQVAALPYTTHLPEDGYGIRTVQKFLGHSDVRTTMIYTQVMDKGPMGVKSPSAWLAGSNIGKRNFARR